IGDQKRPLRHQRRLVLRGQRQQRKHRAEAGVAVHLVVGREVPEAFFAFVLHVVVVDNGPGQALYPRLTAPGQRPVFAHGGRENMVVLVEGEVALHERQRLVGMKLGRERAARQVAIDHHLEGVVVQVRPRKIPVVVVGFVEEIKAIQALHPGYFHAHLQVSSIYFRVVPRVVAQLVGAHRVLGRKAGPVVGLAVDARYHVGRKLVYFVAPVFLSGRVEAEGAEQQK
nr:hypothetical protein [Tanacetum cinerariifolium]